MSKIKGFMIENGVLTKYTGNDAEVVIPDGVICIGENAFWREENFQKNTTMTKVVLPNSVTTIESCAFYNCQALREVVLSDSLEVIGKDAFRKCVALENINLVNSITTINEYAFCDCRSLKTFEIPSSVSNIPNGLFSSCHSLVSVIIPHGVTTIGAGVFRWCYSLKEVKIPDSVISMGPARYYSGEVFADCKALESITIPQSITDIYEKTFANCENLKEVIFESNTVSFGKLVFDRCPKLERIVFKGQDISCWKSFGDALPMLKIYLPSEMYSKKSNISAYLVPYVAAKDANEVAGLWIYQSGKAWDAWFEKQSFDACDVLKAIAALLSTQKKITPKQIARIQEFGEKYSSVISADSIGEVVDGLLSGNTKTAEAIKNAEVVKIEKINTQKSIPLEQQYASASSFSAELDCVTKGVRYKDYDVECSLPVIKTLLEEYLALWNENKRAYHGAMSSGYNLGPIRQLKKPEEAEKIAAELDPEALSDYLEKLAFGKDYRFFAIPYARFATENSMQRCVKEIASKMKGNAKNQYWAGSLKEALQYSDTRAAAEYLEKYPMDFAKYTRLRGITVQEYRDIYSVPDFGFDKDGTKKYVVDGVEIKAQIANTCSLYLTDSASGKLIKSISKKTAEGAKASEEYTSLKKNFEEFYSKRKEYIKKIYITAEAITEKSWSTIYTVNPLFRPIIESLIWVDSKDVCFEVVSGKCKNVNGDEYTPIGNIKIAHVMNMTTTQVSEWQRHLIANQKSLIIEQVWEPVINLDNISRLSSRYNGVVMSKQERNSFKKALKEKAIDVRSEVQKGEYDHRAGKYVYDSNGTMLVGARLRLDYEVDETTGDITLGVLRNLDSLVSKRELNTIIFELDRATLKSVILKDDISALSDDLLSTFTVAQISEFVDCAIKNNCTNCTAYLLNYKNEKFGEDSVFDMFVLD